MKTWLSIVCVTKAEPYALPFLEHLSLVASKTNAQLVIAADGPDAVKPLLDMTWMRYPLIASVTSKGYIESVLDQALSYCDGQYVLRLDDDERCSDAMVAWLVDGGYTADDHWKFPRAHLWGDERHVLMHPQLWPDHQTRLSVRIKAGQRKSIHCGSPFGGGAEAPVLIEHHKFIVKTVEERRAIVARYDRIAPGAGSGMLVFSVPEDVPSVAAAPVVPLESL